MNPRGRFIVIEGMEGAGKSTVVQGMSEYLQKQGQEFIVTREPGGTETGEKIRKLIKEKQENEVLRPKAELLLMYAARVQLVEQIIKPALARGCWVIADRFELSTYAYQGGGRGICSEDILALSQICLHNFTPDLTFFLDLSPQDGLARIRARGSLDRIEQESLAFFERVYRSYKDTIRTMNDVIVIDAAQSQDEVALNITNYLSSLLNSDL